MAGRLGLGRRARRLTGKRLAIVIVAAFAIAIVGWWMLRSNPPTLYISSPITRGSLAVTVSATGTLAPRTQVDVGSEVSGRIDELYADFNDHVTKGQKLAKINTDQIKAQLDQSQATLAQARATLDQDHQNVDRYAKLRVSNSVSPQAYDAAVGDYGRAKAGVSLAAAQVQADETLLTKATIFSPIDGVVLDRKVSRGQTVVAAMTTPVLYTLASDLSQMELDVDIDEADVGAVRPGQAATFTVDAYPNKSFSATLISIHSAPQTVQGVVTYRGVLLVQNPELLLKPGMTATATIMAAKVNDTLLVPNAALRFMAPDEISKAALPPPTIPNEGRVWTESGKTLKPHDLKLGSTDGRLTQILSGNLKVGNQVVTDIKPADDKNK